MSSFKGFDDVHCKDDHAEFELKTSKKSHREKLLKAAANKKVESPCASLPPSCRLVQQEEPSSNLSALEVQPAVPPTSTTTDQTQPRHVGETCEDNSPVKQPSTSPITSPTSTNTKLPSTVKHSGPVISLDTPPSNEVRLSKLEEFQSKQKLIEEQNRKRREMLSQAIISRKRQTDQETKKLELVQVELAQIDMMLNNDVKFLRNSIEQVSLEFMEAQKRYDRAEQEFVAAKLHLFATLERKELLTDHLCAIIEQNELRKAKKLEELMLELSLSPDVETSKH